MNSHSQPSCALDVPALLLTSLLALAARRTRMPAERDEEDLLYRRARLFAWRLDRAYASAANGERLADVFESFRQIAPDLEELGRTAVDWLDLVETLVQEAERTYGSAPGRGALKAAQVKAVLVNLALSQQTLLLSHVPRIYRALLVEAVVGWAVDLVVTLLNHDQALWDTAAQSTSAMRVTFYRPMMWLLAFGNWLQGLPIGDWIERQLNAAVLKANPLSPALATQLRKMSAPAAARSTAESFVQLIEWGGAHRKQLTALIELASVVVREADGFIEMSGAEKKEYASDLILVFIEDEGLLDNNPVAEAFARWAIDWGIEFVVTVIRKRASVPATSEAPPRTLQAGG